MFKKKKSINLSYDDQGLIYFVCKKYKKLPCELRLRIEKLCKLCAGEDWKPLFLLVTEPTGRGKDIEQLASDYYISSKRLARYRKRFYESWDGYIGQSIEVSIKENVR